VQSDLVIANDSGRRSLRGRGALRNTGDPADSTSTWRNVDGDELGTLLGADAIERGVPGIFANSVVSSTMRRDRLRHGTPPRDDPDGLSSGSAGCPGLGLGYEEGSATAASPRADARQGWITALVTILGWRPN